MAIARFNPDGLPIYPLQGAPSGLKTERQLEEDYGKKPGGPPRAILEAGLGGVDLYALDEAIPLPSDNE